MLQSKSLEQLRQRVIASCHLGPLCADEVRPYVEHRLRHVGWNGEPIFAEGAFAPICDLTDGIPRRINLLCTRAMLAAFLRPSHKITEGDIVQTAKDLGAEVGETPLRIASISSL
jgi:type II secretory pathway predicted ATPase ExeA